MLGFSSDYVRSCTGRTPTPHEAIAPLPSCFLTDSPQGGSAIRGSGLSGLQRVVQPHLAPRDVAQLFVLLLYSSKPAASPDHTGAFSHLCSP